MMPTNRNSVSSLTGHLIGRRRLLSLAALGGVATLAACSAPAASPTAAPAQPTAGGQPTAPTKPAQPTTTTSQPTAQAQPTAAPKQTFTEVKLAMATARTTAGSVPWRLGIAQGIFKEFGIDLEPKVVQGSNNVIAALVSGEAQLAEGGVPAALAAISKGSNFKLLAGSYVKPAYAVFSNPDIKSLKDLEGRAIGSDRPGSLTYSITQLLLKEANVDVSKIEVVAIGSSPDIYRAVVGGKVDAGLGAITFIPSAESDGVAVLVKVWEALPNYAASCYYTTTDILADRRDVIVRALAAIHRSHEYSRTDEAKDPWIKTSIEELGTDATQAEFEYQWMRDNSGFAYDLMLTPQQIEYMQNANIEAGTQETLVPFEQVTDLSLAREALELAKR